MILVLARSLMVNTMTHSSPEWRICVIQAVHAAEQRMLQARDQHQLESARRDWRAARAALIHP
jgi:predicted oxidoreductase